jgi:hypothetical protein
MLSASCPCFDLCLVRTVDSGLVDDGLGVIQAMPFETGERRLGPWAAYGARCSVVAGCTHDDMELSGFFFKKREYINILTFASINT